MKTKLLLSALLSFYFYLLSSQVPQGFNYQAIARDGSGNPITGQTMQVKIGILSDTIANIMVWEELFNPVKTNAFGMFTIVVGTGVKQSGSAGTFSNIDWTKAPLFLRTSIYYPSSWKVMGTSKLQSVPYSMVAGNLEGSVPLLSVKGNTATMDSALFVVRNNTGQIVFAVYNEGVRIYVDDGKAKGATKGGFAIGGFGTAKGTSQPLFVVDPDSIRAYIDNNPVKAVKGGFAIGGFDRTKATGNQQFLTVSDDSVRVYIDDNLTKATTKGGFAIGSFDKSKGGNTNFFNVSPDSTGRIYPSQNRILWYPLKNALLAGKVIAENKDSVGVNSFASGYESRSKGKYSQALGYKAIARGDYSTAIGKNAVANSTNSFSFGDGSRSLKNDSYAFGSGATAQGLGSYAFGSAGRDTLGNLTGLITSANGDYSFAIGQGSIATGMGAFALGINVTASGKSSTAMGYQTISSQTSAFATGYKTNANGVFSTALGCQNQANGGFSTALGYLTYANGEMSTSLGASTLALGNYSTAMGYQTVANGTYTTSIGVYNHAEAYASLVIGRYNLITGSTTTWQVTDPLFVIGNGSSNSLRSNAVTVLKNGNFGIGTSTPQISLHIKANGPLLNLEGTDHTYIQWFPQGFSTGRKAYIGFPNAGSTDLTIVNEFTSGSGSIILQPGTNGKVLVNGNIQISANGFGVWFKDETTGTNWQVHSHGDVLRMYNGSVETIVGTQISSRRWKENIKPMENMLEKINQLKGVTFTWKSGYGKGGNDLGFIAEEVGKVFPDLVTYEKNGVDAVTLNYSIMSAIAIEGIKELSKQKISMELQIAIQQDQIESTKKENQQLRSELDELKTLVNQLVANQTLQGNK